MSPRLSETTLRAAACRTPSYDRSAVGIGIVHLGLGAFSRAHLASHVDDLLSLGRRDLGIIGVSLRSSGVAEALGPQDGLYVRAIVEDDRIDTRIIGAIRGVLATSTGSARIRTALTAPTTRLVTVTVTEKGYCLDASTGRLDTTHPDVLHDLASPDDPISLPGWIALAARLRRDEHGQGFTVASLDNLPANGRSLQRAVLDLAGESGSDLAAWVGEHVHFPCSMVDRMVPATDETLRARVRGLTGVDDALPVKTEPYSQWVLERSESAEFASFADVGVTFVDDVRPWERTKLQVLNALHTTAALIGLRHGLETIAEVMHDDPGRTLILRVADELAGVVDPPTGLDLVAYVETTLHRFENRALHHRCAQIATDSSQKLPQRLLPPLSLRLERGLPVNALGEVLALWAWSTLGRDHRGSDRTVRDPLAETYRHIALHHATNPAGLLRALLGLRQVFGTLADDERLFAVVEPHLTRLMTH